jgi:DNA-binding Lrp family transcriptional regulator
MLDLDNKDQGLIALLRANARISVAELAKQLKVSRATVQNRMRRLEKEQVILGYTIALGPVVKEPTVRALMDMNVESKKGTKLVAKLRGNPHVSAVHHTMGRWDLIVEIQTESLASLNKIVGELRLIEGVTATETNLLLDSYE